MKKSVVLVCATALGLSAVPAVAVEMSVSGFGTLGYARSDQTLNYQAHVNDQGTLKRDSLLGLQVDARLNDQFSVTVQAKVAPSLRSDHGVDGTVSWAFLSWRPANDLLFRAGRLRVPLYLQSENTDVGATFNVARLPTEVYSTTPTTDFDGVSLSKTWSLAAGELTLDGYLGRANATLRSQLRDLGTVSFVDTVVHARGLALTLQQDDNTFRVGAHDAYAKGTNGQRGALTYPFVPLGGGFGYYQISNLMPGPGVTEVDQVHSPVFTLGADVGVGYGARVMAEYVRRDVRNLVSGADTQGAYITVSRPVGAWTPYLSVGRLLTMPEPRNLYKRINSNTVPGEPALNATQRIGADILTIYDQTTWAVGTSYRLNPTSKLKAEWARIKVGEGSAFIDALPGGESANTVTNVLSLSYNFVF